MKNKKIPLIVIAGPTGIGKSYLGFQVAQELNTPIISADSRQIYIDFNIGTAKPTIEEQKLISHYMIDVCTPEKTYTVADYVSEVRKIIEKIYSENKIPLLVGGTGLYIKSLLQNYSMPALEPLLDFREKMKALAEEKGSLFLYEKALAIDPIAMEKIHQNDLVRMIRVLEVFEATGKKISDLQKKDTEPFYDITYIALDIDREKLYERIHTRIDKMFEEGLLDEIKHIMNKYGNDLPLLKTINYGEPKEFLLGNCSFEEAKENMRKNTRNFAKRQLTWFRNDPFVTWKSAENLKDFDIIKEEIISIFK
ncbi:MAG: tRNA (adenosine(37)-N6)-dimethylallyltransferase MiaA [Candidatus Sericytochromatia bacterium]